MGTTPVFVFPFALLVAAAPGPPAYHSPRRTCHCRAGLLNLLRCAPSLVWLFPFPSFSPLPPRILLFAAVAIAFGMRIVAKTGKAGGLRLPLAESDRRGPQQSWKNPKDILKQAGSDHCSWKTSHWEGTNRKQRSLPGTVKPNRFRRAQRATVLTVFRAIKLPP